MVFFLKFIFLQRIFSKDVLQSPADEIVLHGERENVTIHKMYVKCIILEVLLSHSPKAVDDDEEAEKRESTVPPSTLNTASAEGPIVVIWFRGPGLNLVENWHAAKKFDEVHLVSCRSTKTYYQELVGENHKGRHGRVDRPNSIEHSCCAGR